MATKKELFINSIELVELEGRTNVPTVIYYGNGKCHIGYDAFDASSSPDQINENFKLELGAHDVSVINRRQFEIATGETRSAHALTKDFVEEAIKHVFARTEARLLRRAERVLVAEPIAMGETETTRSSWLTNYRAHLRRILESKFGEVDFLPEPFAVFQYYRYGIRHPLVAGQARHVALVLDFGGGTFDVSVIETTTQGDISAGGRNSRPLAAASIPVGGFFINRIIAETLLFEVLGKNADKGEIQKALRSYDDYRNASSDDLSSIRADFRNFIRNFKTTVHEVEKAKISICNSIIDWDLEAQYQPLPAYQVKVSRTPLRTEADWVTVRLDAYKLRDIFERKVWAPKLKTAILDALSRSVKELDGKQISIVLLSGGSSNIRWVANLLRRDLSTRLPDSEILELQENFQEIVAKGLAVECARRTYGRGDGDFRSVTYNRLCLGLKADSEEVEVSRFKAISDGLPSEIKDDGVLLPSGRVLQDFIGLPMTWKVRMKHPPRRQLEYFFMRSSLDYEDVQNVCNVDRRISTPSKTTFDSTIQVELTVRKDGTASPRFVYREGGHGVPYIAVDGTPFYLDMTCGAESSVGEAYIGFDFGTSNSSFSYVERGAIRTYSDRGKDKGWRELSDLVGVLPYPAAAPLAKFMAMTTKAELGRLGLETFEALLALAAYVSYSEYRCVKNRAETKIFKAFSQSSAGPLWGLLRESLKAIGNRGYFSTAYLKLIEAPIFDEIDAAVTAISKSKHGKKIEIDYVRLLGILSNVTHQSFSNMLFGSFENVTRQPLKKEYSGYFRCARGSSPPFVDIFRYKGPESFSEAEVFVCDPTSHTIMQITPLMVWITPDSDARTPETNLYSFDIVRKEDYCFKATRTRPELVVTAESDLAPLLQQLSELRICDQDLSRIDNIVLNQN
ncbi:MAG TPA: hypothetical protein PLG94_17695 [Smithellaceae bacterium]|nr:hypothetical protein [Smithellaceae bacterium]